METVQELRIKEGVILMEALRKDGWQFKKEGKRWKAISPAGQEETNSSLNKLLLNSAWHPMYNK
jgi:hypothetical protein